MNSVEIRSIKNQDWGFTLSALHKGKFSIMPYKYLFSIRLGYWTLQLRAGYTDREEL